MTTWQTFVSLGIFLGFAANLVCYQLSSEHYWRWMFSASSIPALALFLIVPFCSESPRWLLRQDRIGEAFEALVAMHPHHSSMIASGDLLYIYESLHIETEWLFGQAGKAPANQLAQNRRGTQVRTVDGTSRPSIAQASGNDVSLHTSGSISSRSSEVSVIPQTHQIRKATISTRWKIMIRSQRMRS